MKVTKLPALSLAVVNVRVKFVWVCFSMRRPAGAATVVVIATVLQQSSARTSDQERPSNRRKISVQLFRTERR